MNHIRKNDTLDFIKFCSVREPTRKLNDKFANHIFEKRLIYIIYELHLQFNNKTSNPI